MPSEYLVGQQDANLSHFKVTTSMMVNCFCIETVTLEVLEHNYCEIRDGSFNYFSCHSALESIFSEIQGTATYSPLSIANSCNNIWTSLKIDGGVYI